VKWAIVLTILALVCFGGWAAAPAVRDFVQRGRRLTSSSKRDDGVIVETPSELASLAGDDIGRDVAVEAYALARMIRSEAGNRDVAEKVAVAWVAVNDAFALGWALLRTLTYHTAAARNGRFGPQIGGRYATTSDPYENDLAIAEAVLAGELDDPTGGATKFVHRNAFGTQPGTRTFEEVSAAWLAEGYVAAELPDVASDFVVFRKGNFA
jgi:hypothetical protein